MGNLNKIGGLYQRQCPGCDLMLKFCKMLEETAKKDAQPLSVVFHTIACDFTITSKLKVKKKTKQELQNRMSR